MNVSKNLPFLLTAICSLLLVFAGCTCKPGDIEEEKVVQPAAMSTPSAITGESEVSRPAEVSDEVIRVGNQVVDLGDKIYPIYFDFDKSELRPDARDTLTELAQWLKANPSVNIRVDGHCDERGANEYNLALGENRAAAAKKYLVYLGIAAQRLETLSYGEEKPSCREANEACWSKNRRDDFTITGK